MIALPQALPMVNWHGRRHVPLSEGWLAESIACSARRAGYPTWEWSGEVARAITYFLQEEYRGNLISPEELRAIIRRSLSGIGCQDVAEKVSLVAPRVSIYLPELAERSGMEMLFFQSLGERIDEAVQVVVRGIRLEGIRPCVKNLEQCRRWHRGCQRLSDEIVLYTRRRLELAGAAPMELAIY